MSKSRTGRQAGLKQRDRLLSAMSQMRRRIPLSISGDLHAVAIGRILRKRHARPVGKSGGGCLSGPIGTGPGNWPSGIRKVGVTPPNHLSVDEQVKPVEQHGFTIADFTPEAIV